MSSPRFYNLASPITLGEAVELSGAKLLNEGYSERLIKNLSSCEKASKDSLIFIENKKYLLNIKNLSVAAVLCTAEIAEAIPSHIAVLVAKRPYYSFCIIANFLYQVPLTSDNSHLDSNFPNSYVDKTAILEENVIIEAGAHIGAHVQIGKNTIIKALATIGPNCTVGRDCLIGYGVTLQFAMLGDKVILHPGARVGQDGFGYLPASDGITKIPQLGRVIIQDNVEIGANSTIDRGSLDDTIIGEGTKIDNLVQIAHNVRLGRFCVIAGHCGISGSVTVGDQTLLGGHVGIKDHIKIGSRVAIAAASGVMNDIPDGETWGGVPARPVKQWFREVITLRNLGISGK
ncbi:UDP-3-O-(3-hydroxymyristoyl)glucosamine N-acyltransferase [Bartonella sp. TP]|uniref:UDP-3-O-(3-hydroxymyristoyl)glucosamine N-acyltransferase n=1 Tax=Bartonella sp. TP TaxID=3057550 RepID=UPI0025B1DC99|nr:UDP-3-O-(3-hydroxymyristoyl)glucosamine N-acyltransferase [Bartonella sp. TP]WJW79877.1 UDP-3-O-(3-hydroxymyristoyl)glucosamine N-acyltransferase [Bartonella sp. TP]